MPLSARLQGCQHPVRPAPDARRCADHRAAGRPAHRPPAALVVADRLVLVAWPWRSPSSNAAVRSAPGIVAVAAHRGVGSPHPTSGRGGGVQTGRDAAWLGAIVEEQLVATPTSPLPPSWPAGGIGQGPQGRMIRWGFLHALTSSAAPWLACAAAVAFVQSILAASILLDPRENAFCVAMERAGSILGGLAATYVLWLGLNQPAPTSAELRAAFARPPPPGAARAGAADGGAPPSRTRRCRAGQGRVNLAPWSPAALRTIERRERAPAKAGLAQAEA